MLTRSTQPKTRFTSSHSRGNARRALQAARSCLKDAMIDLRAIPVDEQAKRDLSRDLNAAIDLIVRTEEALSSTRRSAR